MVDELGSTRRLPTSDGSDAAPMGAMLGRYVLMSRLGEGGGGEVFRAFDPVLDRKVAVKRLRGRGQQAAALMREARILARLNHPHVVTVHDVGIDGDRPYLAMELVEGSDLASWLREHGRTTPWRVTLRMLASAGLGLAAAHEQGIVHGDIKPANILVGDERVLVTDFGVARLHRLYEADNDDAQWRGAGTPRYMAPEQHEGAAPDAKSDIYSFALTTWEALFGVHPFDDDADRRETSAGTTAAAPLERATPGRSDAAVLAELFAAKMRGTIAAPERTRGVPGRVLDALRRGLAPNPEDRPASMRALLAALAYDPARRRRRWLAIGGAAIVVASLASAVASQRSAADPRCTGGSAALSGIWDDDRRAEVRDAAARLGSQWSATTALWVIDNLDGYADAWAQMHRSNCEATTIRAEQSERDMDLRARCLQRARSELAATVDLLADADVDVARRAHQMVDQLPAIDRCADVVLLEDDALVPDDPETATAVEAAREELARAKALERAGRYRECLALLEPLAARAETLGFAPLQVEIGMLHGFALGRLARAEEAEATWRKTVELAVEHGPSAVGSRAAAMLASHLSDFDARFAEADAYSGIAVSLARHAEPGSTAEAYALNRRGSVRLEQNRVDEAERDYTAALRIWERVRGPDHPDVAMGLTSLGRMYAHRREHDLAEDHYRRAHEMLVRAFGEAHPEAATGLTNLGTVFEAKGDYARGLEYHERALAILEPALGSDHIEVSAALTNIGVCQNNLGMREEAEATHRRALAIVEREHGPDHVEVGRVLINIGVIQLMQQRFAEAEATYARSLTILERALGEAHPHAATTITNLAIAIASQGRHADAQAVFERALAIREKTLPPDHPSIASTLGNLAQLEYEQGKLHAAAAHFERSLAIRIQRNAAPKDRAFESFGLARTRWALGEQTRALELARQALAAYVEAGEGYRDRHDEVAQWIATHE